MQLSADGGTGPKHLCVHGPDDQDQPAKIQLLHDWSEQIDVVVHYLLTVLTTDRQLSAHSQTHNQA